MYRGIYIYIHTVGFFFLSPSFFFFQRGICFYCKDICVYIYVYLCVYVYMYVYVCIYIQGCGGFCLYIYNSVFFSPLPSFIREVFFCVFMYICVYIYLYLCYIYIYTYIYIGLSVYIYMYGSGFQRGRRPGSGRHEHWAAQRGHDAVAKVLLSAGADINAIGPVRTLN